MQSRTSYSLVATLLLTAMACAHQVDPDGAQIFDASGDGGSTAGMPPKGGTSTIPVGGSTSISGSTSVPIAGKAGSKATGGAGGTASGGSGGSGGGSDSGGMTAHMPLDGIKVEFKAQSPSTTDPMDYVGGELSVANDSVEVFPLKDLKVRYYFSNDSTAVEPKFVWQWGQFGKLGNMPAVTCSGQVVVMPDPKPTADHYVELNCDTADSFERQGRLLMSWKAGTQDQSTKLTQSNDYSFAAMGENPKIVVLNGNTVIWGIEP